ncbi:hypothetical protein CDAR_494131 [Caerostris darwini]|uniref:Uncharacterized protein n=1 Tax=Caerostris darwini TaxID=1538125 RepID=A0AAV4UNZ3_9ARAC|nr:hypothetical protein CDAR_494131 [Caerostris darwini]
MDPAPVLTEADVCRKITAATQLLTERRKLHDLATQAITKQQILMDAGLVTAKTIKASAATIKKAAEAVSDAENQDTIAIFIARIRKHFKRLMDAGHPLEDMYPAFQSIRTLPPGPLSVDVYVVELLKWN